MSKELTEQWRNGTLKTGSYYIRIITRNEKSDYFDGKKFCFWSDYEIEEVLAAVPSYEQYIGLIDDSKELDKAYDKINLLEKKLNIAVKALNKIYEVFVNNTNQFQYIVQYTKRKAKQTLKEINKIKKS